MPPGRVLSASVSSVPARTCADEQGQGSTLPNTSGSDLYLLPSLVPREAGEGPGWAGRSAASAHRAVCGLGSPDAPLTLSLQGRYRLLSWLGGVV